MELKNILNIVQIVTSILLILSILSQQQGTGLGSMFGGSGGEGYRSKRGIEKILFNATIILAVIFVANGLAIALLKAA
jgi:preprotein translocase subunit SecG